MLIFAPHHFKCCNLHNQKHFSLIVESWLFRNVGFYRSFLPFYVLRTILEILILGSMTEIWNANVWKDVIFNSYTVSSKWWNMTTKKFLERWHSKFKCFKLHVAYYSVITWKVNCIRLCSVSLTTVVFIEEWTPPLYVKYPTVCLSSCRASTVWSDKRKYC